MSWLNYPAERERAQSSRVNTARNSRNGPGVLLGLQASLELIDTGEVWMESHLHLITAVVTTLTQRRKASKSGRAIPTYQVTPSKIQLITRAHQIPCPCYAMFDFVTSEMGATRAELSLCQYPGSSVQFEVQYMQIDPLLTPFDGVANEASSTSCWVAAQCILKRGKSLQLVSKQI